MADFRNISDFLFLRKLHAFEFLPTLSACTFFLMCIGKGWGWWGSETWTGLAHSIKKILKKNLTFI